MCPGLDQAGGSSGVSQDEFWHWVQGLGEEELLDLWEILEMWEVLSLCELMALSEFLGLWELQDLWELLVLQELVSFWELLGLKRAFRFLGRFWIYESPWVCFVPGVVNLPQPFAWSRSCKLPLFLSNHHRPQNKARRNPIKQPEKLLLAAGAPGREGKNWLWRELSADSH